MEIVMHIISVHGPTMCALQQLVVGSPL